MHIPVDINIDFLWGDKHFIKSEWGDITYIVGPNGTGKSIFAEKLRDSLKEKGYKVRYFGADRIVNLASKWDQKGNLIPDYHSRGFNIDRFKDYKSAAEKLGQSVDALIELQNNLDLQIMIESMLSDIFHKKISFKENGGFLNVSIIDKKTRMTYDFRVNESHGLKELITLLTFIYSKDYNYIILDEPELNLHPQFQQFILQEIKKVAGSDDGKKMFVILTHSPYMLDISNTSDLLNYIVFHNGSVPSFIKEYKFDTYKMNRLNRLLLRINANHKSLFFATTPIFVEGYIDQQILNLIAYKHDIPMGAEGVSIIDVGGKDEVDIMYSLCQLLGISAKVVLDLDALLEGKMRQTVESLSEPNQYLASLGYKTMALEIGELSTVIDNIAKSVLAIAPQETSQLNQEFLCFLKILKSFSTNPTPERSMRKVTLLAIQRIPSILLDYVDDDSKNDIRRACGLVDVIIKSFEIVNVFILSRGEIENYYSTYEDNQYAITDNNKVNSFLKEYDTIKDFSQDKLLTKHSDLIDLLYKLCPIKDINVKYMLSLNIGDWIHIIQKMFRTYTSIDMEVIKKDPQAQWNKFEKIIDLLDFSSSQEDNTFTCTFKIKPHLANDCKEPYSFDQNTVLSKFSL